MPPPLSLVPLGSASAVPSLSRNHSSLAVVLPSSATLLFDVGEATQHQIQRFRPTAHVKLGKIEKIFITHLHGDHIFGLCPLLATLMNGAGGSENDPRLLDTNSTSNDLVDPADRVARVELYGPKGLREFVRSTLNLTYTHLDGWYVVHELHFPADSPSDPSQNLYEKELSTGRNISQDNACFWRDICIWSNLKNGHKEFSISAGPIVHSVPSIGYVLQESDLPGKIPADYPKRIALHKEALIKSTGLSNPMVFLQTIQNPDCPHYVNMRLPDGTKLERPKLRPGRKITILGDTSDPSAMASLAMYSDVLVHEATNAFLPGIDVETKEGESYDDVEEKTRSRGHSTPEMAGRFARSIKLGLRFSNCGQIGQGGRETGLLILNHFSTRYKDDEADDGPAKKIMEGIALCAKRAWLDGIEGSGLQTMDADEAKGGGQVICARDGVKIDIKPID